MRARRRELFRTLLVSVGLVVAMIAAFYITPWEGGSTTAVMVRILVASAALVVAVVLGVRDVGRAEFPMLRMFETLTGIVSFAVVTFASSYMVLSNANPDAFSEPLGHTDALYFAMTTITTVGFGDIAARSEGARIVVMVQMVVDVLVLGVAARTLVRSARQADT